MTSALGWPFDGPKKNPPVVGRKVPLLRTLLRTILRALLKCGDRATDRWKGECVEAETLRAPAWATPAWPNVWLDATLSATPRDIVKTTHTLYVMTRPPIRNIPTHTRPGFSRPPIH